LVKLDIRWQLLLAATCLSLVLSILSFQAQSVGFCSMRVPATGGVLAEGIMGAPQRLNPLLSDDNPVDRELVSLIFDGLTRYDEQGRLQPALARSWSVSDDGRTVTFTLREDSVWHDGRPVTAADVLFSYSLLQHDDFPAPAAARVLWQSVTISSEQAGEVAFTLPAAYAPFLDATTRGILPAHLLAEVPAAELAGHAFNYAPVGTGPFKIAPGSDWRRNGRLRLAPNLAYWRQGMDLDGLEFRFYPDEAALLAAFAVGEIQALNRIQAAAIPAALRLPGARLFSAPIPRYSQLLFNVSGTGSTVVHRLETRQALAHAIDRQALIDEALNGQGIPFNGPYLPGNWAYNQGAVSEYGDRATAVTLLDNAGWLLAEGDTVRQREGVPLLVRLLFIDEPRQAATAGALTRQWQALGIGAELLPMPAEMMRQALSEREFDVALVDIEPPGDPDLYDFWSQEAIVRGQNYAGWNNRRASEALEAARQLWPVEERRPYYDAFLRFFNNDLPALSLYQHIYTYALSESVQQEGGGLADIGRIDHPRDRYQTMADWFLFYQDVTVACPEPDDSP
jgi:peptide/nickel transport system substrate-binding protein